MQGENMLRKGRNCLLDHPSFSCNDLSTCTSTVVVRERRLIPQTVQQETKYVKGFHLAGIKICSKRVSSVPNKIAISHNSCLEAAEQS